MIRVSQYRLPQRTGQLLIKSNKGLTMKKLMCVAALLASISSPAFATVLTLDSGWQGDSLQVAGSPTVNSDWTFTISGPATFSLVDCCVVGDVFTLSGGISGVTTFFAGPNDIRASVSEWTDAAYSKFTSLVGPGSYTFSITGDGAGGLSAGLSLRLDSGDLSVPEPASWALMIAGFGLVGGAMRRRRVTVSYA
jgi:PEP-CTERM motif